MAKEYKKINGQHDPTITQWQKTTYLFKDLPIPFTQTLYHKLTWDDYAFIKQLSEGEQGLKWFTDLGFSRNEIDRIKDEASKYFREVNEMMTWASREPLYPHPEDAVASSKRHFDLLKLIPYEEIVEYYGSEFPDYEPVRINNGVISREDDKIFYSYDGIKYEFSERDNDLILSRYRELWHRSCTFHNPFAIEKLFEDKSVTMPNGKTYDIDSFCRIMAAMIRSNIPELDLRELKTVEIVGDNYFGSYDKTRTACRGIVVKNYQILLVHETATGQFMIPGGGLEPQESEEECCSREISEETGLLVEPAVCALKINEYYEDCKYTSLYYLCVIKGTSDIKLTEQEKETGLEPCWISTDKALKIFSEHAEYADSDEERRGIYLREYTALKEILRNRI